MEVATSTGEATRARSTGEGAADHRRDARQRWKARSRGLTFDHVARQAGVSRGLLHYFGSKERLLVEVVRHDCEVRNRNMDERLAQASTADEILEALVAGLNEFLEDDQGGQAVIYEMLSASRHSDDPRELAELYRQWRERLAGWLRLKEEEGAIALDVSPRPWLRCCSRSATARDTGSRGSGMGPGPHLRARRRDGALDARIAAGKLSPGHLFRFCFCKRSHSPRREVRPVGSRARRGFSAWPALTRSGLDRRSRGGRSHPPGARA